VQNLQLKDNAWKQ